MAETPARGFAASLRRWSPALHLVAAGILLLETVYWLAQPCTGDFLCEPIVGVFTAMGLIPLVFALAVATACGRISKDVKLAPDPAASVDELWQQPVDLERRDLFYGAGGKAHFPKQTTFTFVARDTSGWSPGLDVRDDAGVEWSVKLGPEAQSEVVASRVLWAIGLLG